MRKSVLFLMSLCAAVNGWAGSGDEPVEPFDRGIGVSNTVFVPKGTVCTGVNFSYNTIDLGTAAGDSGYSMLFDMISGLNASMYTFGLAPHASYFLQDNLSLGVRLDYDRSSLDLGNAALTFGDGVSFGVSDYHLLQQMFGGSVTMRYYMAIADSKRFAIFAEVRATGGFGQSKMWQVEGDNKFGTYEQTVKGALTCVPGICVFAHDNVAVEVAIGILGINYHRTEQVRNQVEHSTMQTSGANFRINPLAIEIGTCFYFYSDQCAMKPKMKTRR